MDENAGVGVASERAHPGTSAAEPRYCRWCGTKSETTAEFCGECGEPLGAAQDTSEQPTAQWAAGASEPTWQAPPAAGAAPGMQIGPPPPPGYVPYPYAGEPPSGGSHTGLLIALIAAVIAALGAVAAVVILASSGGGTGPTISAATNAAVRTVTTTTSTSTRHSPAHHGTSTTAVVPPAPPTSTVAPPPPQPSPADATAASATVFNHWTLIGRGQLRGGLRAVRDPDTRTKAPGSRTRTTDRPVVSNLVVGSADMHSATSATVPLVSLNTVGQQAPQCHNWTGSYDLTKVGGSWLISQANLNGTTC